MQDSSSPIVFKQLTFEDSPDSKLFFDKFSQKIIVITNKSIKIYNQSGEILKTTIPIQLKRELIQLAIVDKELTYILLLVHNANNEYWVSCLDIKKACQEGDILKTDFTNVIGMFFLNKKQEQSFSNHNATIQGTNFCLLFNSRLMVISINSELKEKTKAKNSMIPIYTEKFNASDEVINYAYSPKHMILCCETRELKFRFFNLSNKAYFDKSFLNSIPSMKSLKNQRKTTSSKNNKKQKESLISKTYSIDKYAKCQFFLQTLYKNLYFIHLNMIEGKIVLYLIVNLNTVEFQQEIQFKSSFATLQFIDNLIVFHDFQNEASTLYDVHMKNKNYEYFKSFPMTNYALLQRNQTISKQLVSCEIVFNQTNISNGSNENNKYQLCLNLLFPNKTEISMLNYSNNSIIYDKEVIVNGVMLEETCGFSLDSIRNTTFYYTYFDAALFYQAYLNSETFEPVTNLIRRKNSKETILNALISMIIQNNKVHIINLVFRHILHLLNQSYKNTNKGTSINKSPTINSKTADMPSPSELPKPEFKPANKKTRITQSDVLLTFVKQFKYHPTVHPLYIIELLMHFLKSLKILHIPIQENFNDILLSFVVKHNDMSSLLIFLQYGSIPETVGLANYLLKQSEFKETLFQMGIDILIRLKRFDEVVITLLQQNRLREALLFMINNNLQKKTFVKKIKAFLNIKTEDKKFVIQFLESII